MRLLHVSTALLVVGWAVACGSSASAPQDEATVASFAGQGNVPTEKSCNVDADCDNHDPCTTFTCKKDSGEIAVGRCVYGLGDGKACAAPPPDAGAQTIVTPEEAGVVDAAAADVGSNACSKALTVKITSSSLTTCSFNTTVEASSPATLAYVCAGGNATVTFGTQVFTGTETGGTVSVSNVSSYLFTNVKYNVTCRYTATQTISGTVASGKLTWGYTEVLDPKQPALCPFVTTACTGGGDVTVQ